jgi:two-component system cell cycle sensor histidine kinase/response regulator CckA
MESVGRLAGGVAHEANNQMSVVIGASEFVLARPDIPQAVRADVETIRSAALRTAAVTAQLLAFSRRQVLKPQALDLDAVLERFLPVLRRAMGEDCTVLLVPGRDVGKVMADPGQLEQVLLNLAINARDAMPRGGTLTLETAEVELTERTAGLRHGVAVRPGRYAQLAVTDTGHGMDRATLTQIFEPFFTTKEIGQGSGLGLATVYGIVKQSEGYVWAYSEPDHGTTLKVYLPLTGQPVVPPEPRGDRPPRGAGELILVVEDEAQVRQIAARALAEAGYRVLQADGGERALELVSHSADRIGLVLTDVVMPLMNGPELAAALAELRPGTPVLFTSGYTDGDIFRRGLLAPGAAFLPKPFTADMLVRAVRERIDAVAAEQGRSSSAAG